MQRFAFCILSLLICVCGQASVFYKITGNGIEKPSYILGTHHLAPLSFLDSIPAIKEAMESCDIEVGEIDMTVSPMAIAFATQKYMIAPSDSTLSRLLPTDEYLDLAKKFESISPAPGLTLQSLDMLRPMALTAAVTVGIMAREIPEFDNDAQLDSHIQGIFKESGRKIIPLESAEQQAELLYTFVPISEQVEDLRNLLNNPEECVLLSKELNEAYFAGDIEKLYALSLQEDGNPAFTDALVRKRNINWVDKIPAIIESYPTFIAVGALHLPGPDGIISLLSQKGYTLTPVLTEK